MNSRMFNQWIATSIESITIRRVHRRAPLKRRCLMCSGWLRWRRRRWLLWFHRKYHASFHSRRCLCCRPVSCRRCRDFQSASTLCGKNGINYGWFSKETHQCHSPGRGEGQFQIVCVQKLLAALLLSLSGECDFQIGLHNGDVAGAFAGNWNDQNPTGDLVWSNETQLLSNEAKLILSFWILVEPPEMANDRYELVERLANAFRNYLILVHTWSFKPLNSTSLKVKSIFTGLDAPWLMEIDEMCNGSIGTRLMPGDPVAQRNSSVNRKFLNGGVHWSTYLLAELARHSSLPF